MDTILITGASRGLGLALARRLAADRTRLLVDARGAEALARATAPLAAATELVAIAGDVADERHRQELTAAARRLGGLNAIVLNAGVLGPSPQPTLLDYPLGDLERVLGINALAQLRLAQLLVPVLRPGGVLMAITSDAAVEAYPGWGGYGASKAALEQLFAVLGVERPELRVLRVDPGDMRTQMHQDAFPGEDISDRAEAEASVPGIVALLRGDQPSGRYAARAVSRVTA